MHQVEVATTQQSLLDAPEMTLNMGPQHPSTHGVLRVILKLDGETVIDLDCDIGYLHRGMEKIAENRLYPMIAPYWDRLDYIAAVSNGLVWVETVEQMLGLEISPRARSTSARSPSCSTRCASARRFLKSSSSSSARASPATPGASAVCRTTP